MVDLSIIIHVDGDGHIIEKNVFSKPELLTDPRLLDEIMGSAAIVMEPMMEAASECIGGVCSKIAMMKNERTFRILCESIENDEDEWPITVFPTENTLTMALDSKVATHLMVMAPAKRNCDFSVRRWKMTDVVKCAEGTSEIHGMDMMVFEPTDELDVTMDEITQEIELIGQEYDSNVMTPPSDKEKLAIRKVLDFLKRGLISNPKPDTDYMGAFDNDYDDEVGPEDIMASVSQYVSIILGNYVKYHMFKDALEIQNKLIKKVNTLEDRVNDNEESLNNMRLGLSDAKALGGERVLEELETVNLKYNSVNERLDGIQTQLGNVVTKNNKMDMKQTWIPLAVGIAGILFGIVGIIF